MGEASLINIDPISIVLQVINFVLLVYVLSKFLFKPLKNTIDERAAKVEGALDGAAQREAESYATKREIERRLAEVEKQAEALLTQAQQEAEQQRARVLDAAQERAAEIIANAAKEAEQERVEALKDNYEQILDTVIDLASGVLRSVTVRQTHDDLVNNLAAYIWQRPPEEVTEYRRALAEREPIIFVETPVALTENQQKVLTDTMSSLADRRVELEVQQVPSLIAGLRVRIGDRVVDNSLRQQLEEVREQVGQDLQQQLGMNA